MRLKLFVLGAGAALNAAAPPMAFEPLAPGHEAAAEEYRRIWRDEGAGIVAAMEAATGLVFPDAPVEALVRDGPSMAAFGGTAIRLRAGHSMAQKRAVLVHELGHFLAFTLRRPEGMDDHRLLYLFLYDVWADLYGRDFADRMVALERRNRAHYDYDAAWAWALAMSRDERRARLQALR